jgi:tetratricopeptide (TPR) repeat protein
MNDWRQPLSINCFAFFLLIFIYLALFGCGSSTPVRTQSSVDEEFERINQVARMAFDNGRLQQAVELYEQALGRAYILDDLNAIVDSKYNLAVCYTGLNDYRQALERVNQAKAELSRANRRIPADITLLEATIQHLLGNLVEAQRLTDQILIESNRASAAVLSKTHFLRGLIANETGDIDQLRDAISYLETPAAIGLRADSEELVGLLSMAEGNWNEAIEAFDQTAEFRREDFDHSGMVNALAQAAQACERAGKWSEASKRYLRAGRSAAQQGQNLDALRWLNRAEQLAAQTGDELTAKQARSYRKWLQNP